MSYQVCDYCALGSHHRKGRDIRAAVAAYMGWVKSYRTISDSTGLEPDNYNKGVLALKPVDCPFVRDAVYYKDLKTNKWWSIYYVPPEQEQEFLAWVDKQLIEEYWFHTSPGPIRSRRPLMWVRNNRSGLTDNERLYTMGYYEELSRKYFSQGLEDWLLTRVGTARADIHLYNFELESETL